MNPTAEAAPASIPQDTAAGPWEPYSDEAYERLKDADGRVWALFRRCSPPAFDCYCVTCDSNEWNIVGTTIYYVPCRNPDCIARINPPQEAITND